MVRMAMRLPVDPTCALGGEGTVSMAICMNVKPSPLSGGGHILPLSPQHPAGGGTSTA